MKFRRGVIIAVAKDANFSVGDPEHETIGLTFSSSNSFVLMSTPGGTCVS